MSDRTYHQGTIVASSIRTVDAIKTALLSEGVCEFECEGRVITYSSEDTYLGWTEDSALCGVLAADPLAAYYAWEDPCYGWLGELYVSVGTSHYNASCNSEGDPVLTYATYSAVTDSGADGRQAFGVEIIEAYYEALDQAKKEVSNG